MIMSGVGYSQAVIPTLLAHAPDFNGCGYIIEKRLKRPSSYDGHEGSHNHDVVSLYSSSS